MTDLQPRVVRTMENSDQVADLPSSLTPKAEFSISPRPRAPASPHPRVPAPASPRPRARVRSRRFSAWQSPGDVVQPFLPRFVADDMFQPAGILFGCVFVDLEDFDQETLEHLVTLGDQAGSCEA